MIGQASKLDLLALNSENGTGMSLWLFTCSAGNHLTDMSAPMLAHAIMGKRKLAFLDIQGLLCNHFLRHDKT